MKTKDCFLQKKLPLKILLTFYFLVSILPVFSQAEKSRQPHIQQISSVAFYDDYFFTGSDDGCLIKWDTSTIGEHFQVSDLGIKQIAINPNGYEIAIYETDGFAVHRISVWNWKTKTRKFAKRFSDSINFLSYTKNGSYLMAGTTSVDGLLFLNVQNGTPLSVIQESTGIVSNALSGTTKLVTYDKQGFLKYYSLSEGTKTEQFRCEPNLNDTKFVYRNGRYLVGTKNNSIYIVDSTSGITKNIILSDNPIILKSDDNEFYYIENDSENFCISLKTVDLRAKIEDENGEKITNEDQFSESLIKQLDFSENLTEKEINNAIILDRILYFCMNNGYIFSIGTNYSDQISTASMYTDKADYKINDIEIIDNNYYILVANKLLKGDVINSSTESIANINSTNITATKDNNLILWTKNSDESVYLVSGNQVKELFKPNLPIVSLNTTPKNSEENKIVITEGNQTVSIYDLQTNSLTEIYTGTGLQDAILIGNTLYAAKTSVTPPNSALISIDINTKETVPLQVSGQVIFNLTQRKSNGIDVIYGISNGMQEGKKLTEIFNYVPSTKKYTPQLKWADEDTSAFLRFISGIMYTNIGKSNTRTLDLSSKKASSLKRGAFLPKKIAGNKNYLVTLNQDGSITWYENGTNTKLETWHYCVDGYLTAR